MRTPILHPPYNKVPKRGFLLAMALVASFVLKAQHLVQAAVDGLQDPLVAYEATLLLEQQEGVLMARFDVRTQNMMLRVTPNCQLDRATLNALLAPLALHARCLVRRTALSQPFRHIDPAACTPIPQQYK